MEVGRSSLKTSLVSSNLPIKNRLKRWAEINRIVNADRNKKARAEVDGLTTAYSHIRWTGLYSVFEKMTKPYIQAMVPIPNADFQTLVKVLSWILKCYRGSLIINDNNEAKRLHMIAIVIWAVVQFLPDVTVLVEEDLNGVRVDVHVHFEFVLIRNHVRICIFEAKKDDFEQVIAQSLVGCEVVADIDGSNVVYGVVTKFNHWMFLQSLEDRICIDEFNAITIDAQGVNQANLLTIVGKLHSLLL